MQSLAMTSLWTCLTNADASDILCDMYISQQDCVGHRGRLRFPLEFWMQGVPPASCFSEGWGMESINVVLLGSASGGGSVSGGVQAADWGE